MANFSCFFLFFLVLYFANSYSKAQSVPAIYVFGDSLVDVGNNKHLPLSLLRADLPHNGVDYPGGKPTGRFSNGKNSADFLAEKLGLTTAPPYLSQPNDVFVKGVNFASGGAGIFNATNEDVIKQTIPLPIQLGYFSLVHQRLVKQLGTASAQEHLSKSLFPVVIGSNDLINFSKSKNTPQQFVNLMVSSLKEVLKGLHGLGARKFLVVGTSPIGCAPKQRFQSTTNECNAEVNSLSKNYNQGLQSDNPTTYGFNETKAACCGLGKLKARVPCTPVSEYCSNRSNHVFWDIYHPTQTTAHTFIDILFSDSREYVTPVTIQQLIAI
ncbi:GDSL esterase/lipase At5g55050-like isoform X2 [Olea europaea var. sylvestris]|uniref:GDSL esterase/lipase At5g55050-like isoform X2 n=1 Tax=Olea europaea var. sylvestris TaxID=158386 RepID=UPI000C1D843A|nr:GDSL esterase/lipase At5g55050-like isoform X2 [Olea europaea var. sylvestris]